MAEEIKYDDSLREGTDKINNAIKAFNETVVEGDSSVEAAQARVDIEGIAYETLKDRLDSEQNNINKRLLDINIDMSSKVGKEYLDKELANITKVIQEYNGSLSDLNSDPDVDTSLNYIILDSSDTTNYGYVVYYDESSWVRGWSFQSMGISDESITVSKLSYGTWKGIAKNGAKTAISKNPTQGNYVFGSDGTKSVDEIDTNSDPYFYGLIENGVTVLPTQEFEIQSGGYFFYEARTDNDLAPGNKISVAMRATQDNVGFVKEVSFLNGARETIAIYTLNDYGYGWYFKEGLTVPSGSISVQLRIDARRVPSGSVKFRYPVIQRGYEINDVYYVTEDSIESVIEDKLNKPSVKSGWVPYNAPTQFSWQTHPLVDKIFTDGKGNFEIHNFNIRDYAPVGTSYYVDGVNGNDTNSGSKDSPLKTVKAAYDKTDVTTIYVSEGNYDRNSLFFGSSIQKEVAIIALDGNEVNFHAGNPVAWSATSGRINVYQGTRGGGLPGVIDFNAKDGNGIAKALTLVASVDEVENTPGSYYHDTTAGIVYVHTYNSTAPTDDDLWALSNYTTLVADGGNNLYLEGINVYGGIGCLQVQNTSTNTSPNLFAKGCKFAYTGSDSYDVVMIQGVSLSILEDCIAAYGLKDGFNYHWRNNTIPYSVEINCVGRDNGNNGDGNDQGSTTHDGGKIIRINGVYCRNKGANLAEDSSVNGNSQSWNLGCVCFESASPSPYDSQNVNYLAYQDTKMFLDGCRGYGSSYNLRGEFIYERNSFFTGELRQDSFESIIY